MRTAAGDAETFGPLLTDERRARIAAAVAGRSRTTVVVLEACHDPHNVAAVVRTAEALGVQEVHVVEGAGLGFRAHKKISTRAEKWLDLVRHANVAEAARSLRGRGYRLLAAHPAAQGGSLYDFDFRRKTALWFGNEHGGLSPQALAACDGGFTIPTTGFTRSLNLSVAAAVCMAHAVFFRRALTGQAGDLAPADAAELVARFSRLGVRQHKRVAAALKSQAPADVQPIRRHP